jgi:hypothetical protein
LFPGAELLPDLEPFQGPASFRVLPNFPDLDPFRASRNSLDSASFQASPNFPDLGKELPMPVRLPGSVKRPVPGRPRMSEVPRAEAEPVPSEEHPY